MKTMIYSALIIPLIGLMSICCERINSDDNTDDNTNKVFDINDFALLELGNLTDFWGDVEDIDTFYQENSSIYSDTSFIGGIRLSCENAGQYIAIYVFKSKTAALNDMNAKINTVACVIKEGKSNVISGDWWYTECIPNGVYISKCNTIIQVSYGAGNFVAVKELLYETSNEILKRIDKIVK